MATVTQTNGVLPITASQAASKMQKPSHTRAAGPKLKVVVRRLAPALTEAEFMKTLGDEWKSGGGRVDWASYKPGKDSKDPSKVSRPSRAYLHLTNEAHLIPLSNHVRQLTFEDAASTSTSSCLLGPPSVEYAPYGRIPSGKRRTDARQGTIDLDPEFMDFLESLANPVSTKEEETETVLKAEKVTTTPLVQFLKEKKASKTKEIAVAKASKHSRQEASFSSGKAKAKETAEEAPKKTAKEAKKERLVEKAAREAVKVLNREAATKTATLSHPANAPPVEAPKNPRVVARERGSIAAAARILQRDLGLSPGNAHRRAKVEAEAAKSEAPSTSSAQQGPKAGPSSGAGKAKGRGAPAQTTENGKPKEAPPPIVLLKKPVEPAPAPSPPTPLTAPAGRPSTSASRSSTAAQPPTAAPSTAPAAATKPPPAPSGRKPQPLPVPTPGATRAFVKHANPSQGVTEPLLKDAMETFGAVSHVEIDKRKGFAYVDFVESEGLRKAMAANPTKIAQGTVQVLERKDTKPVREPSGGPRGAFGGGRGGGGGGGGGGGRGSVRRGRGGRGGAGGAAAGEGSASGSASAALATAPSGPAAVGK